MKIEIEIPDQLNPDTVDLVVEFATAVADKLRRAEIKYDYGSGWKNKHWEDQCKDELYKHLYKGDPLDVAIYSAFCWHHGWSTRIETNTVQEIK